MKRARELYIMEEALRREGVFIYPHLLRAVSIGLKDIRREKFRESQKRKQEMEARRCKR